MSINFDPSRSELSNFYWENWRRKSWKMHLVWLLIYLLIALLTVSFKQSLTPLLILQALAIGLFLIGLFIFFPLLFFTQAQRSLKIEKDGVTISLGSRKKMFRWDQISKFNEEQDNFVLTLKGGNGIIVPLRCFDNQEQINSLRQDVAGFMSSPSGQRT